MLFRSKASQVPHHWLMTPPFFYSTHRQTCGTRCCCLSCNRLFKAVPELQQLLLSGLPEHVANLGPEFREAAWRDLAEVVGQGMLSCCCSPSARRGEEQHHQSQVSLLLSVQRQAWGLELFSVCLNLP